MEFMYEPEFWVAVSFFIFIGVLVYLGIHKKVASALDARALRISKELEEARRLREEAEKLLADYRRKLGDVVMEVDNITALANHGSKDPCCGDTPVAEGTCRPPHKARRGEDRPRRDGSGARAAERRGRRCNRSGAKSDRRQAHARSSQEARLREHQGAQDLAAVTTACPAPLEASTWPRH